MWLLYRNRSFYQNSFQNDLIIRKYYQFYKYLSFKAQTNKGDTGLHFRWGKQSSCARMFGISNFRQIRVSMNFLLFQIYMCYFHPILVTWFLVVFGNELTELLRNSLFIFHFILPVLPCKRKTFYRKSGN